MSYSHTSEEESIGTRYQSSKRACDDPHKNFDRIRLVRPAEPPEPTQAESAAIAAKLNAEYQSKNPTA